MSPASANMSAMKSGASLRALVLTPERIPTFIIPSPRNLFMASPMFRRGSPDFSRLLSEDDDEDPSETGPLGTPTNRFSSWSRLRPHTPRPSRPRRAAADADTDPTTRAAMSLPHVQKLTTPYGFRGVLATTPSTNRRESLFHRSRPVKVTVNDAEPEEDPAVTPPAACPDISGRSRVSLRPVKALGRKVMEELKKPAAALMALSPSAHR